MKKYMSQNIFRLFGWMFLAVVACLTGCQTADQADSGDMASVEISGHTEAEIQRATAKVFLSNGYQQADRLTFEKQGTGWDKAAYGGWSSNPVWIKMRANITSVDADKYILGCNAYLVTDRNEATMEEEKKLSVSHRSECKKILDQVKARLDSPPPAGAQ
jgi:uncharacterized protein with beta-barrel porin domain